MGNPIKGSPPIVAALLPHHRMRVANRDSTVWVDRTCGQ